MQQLANEPPCHCCIPVTALEEKNRAATPIMSRVGTINKLFPPVCVILGGVCRRWGWVSFPLGQGALSHISTLSMYWQRWKMYLPVVDIICLEILSSEELQVRSGAFGSLYNNNNNNNTVAAVGGAFWLLLRRGRTSLVSKPTRRERRDMLRVSVRGQVPQTHAQQTHRTVSVTTFSTDSRRDRRGVLYDSSQSPPHPPGGFGTTLQPRGGADRISRIVQI